MERSLLFSFSNEITSHAKVKHVKKIASKVHFFKASECFDNKSEKQKIRNQKNNFSIEKNKLAWLVERCQQGKNKPYRAKIRTRQGNDVNKILRL